MFAFIKLSYLFILLFTCFFLSSLYSSAQTPVWTKFEHTFTSSKDYQNPLYDVKQFTVRFTSPTGRVKQINGFWDGGRIWKVRFAPDEKGTWSWQSICSQQEDTGLQGIKGSFTCTEPVSKLEIYRRGTIIRPKGSYHLSYSDGTPFFWAACTAWNGTLKSTEEEWETYLSNRASIGYSVIQFVTTQWRGADKNSLGQVAFEGSGKIKINPDFFQHLDAKIDKINEHGLVAAPVLLWALPVSQGRELSPGYYLPDGEAILLARYMVARYGGNQVIWILGGDGKYTDEFEQRWKTIGRGVFADEHPGIVAQHPGGGSWIGEVYANEPWLDIVGYQSGHNNSANAVNFITKGTVAKLWDQLPARPLINMEPVYEEINPKITATDVRNASYWSLFNTPTAGITYGANGIWPWLREGEKILNHAGTGEEVSRWRESIHLPGSVQVGYLANFMRTLEWWNLKPAPQLLVQQPGDKTYNQFVSVSRTDDGTTTLVYVPQSMTIQLYNLNGVAFNGQWFNPVANQISKAKVAESKGILAIAPPTQSGDWVLVLKQKNK
ncbi:DUF4038 domain-containing protein [Rhodocytophaga aerolata]|uniref:DUF4038 domain-containing protein n=1 Tax=Rhodocytophaga aerolata TaxID=455078 RepID=A0ABT8RKZ2_9BACT|nr:DUF4038 domain-containing protein [Rhodocytophaga aerolata]MDO1451662.1 DUF4038 domain-containing protein [Rhodocytophaga aerolata]